MPVKLDFTGGVTTLALDFTEEIAGSAIDFIQSMKVDNSQSQSPITFQFDQTYDRVVVPAQAQGVWPVICGSEPRFTATTAGGVIVPIILLNIPMPLTQWGPITAVMSPLSGTFTDISGTGTGASVQIAPPDPARKGHWFMNPSANANSIFVNFGAAAADPSVTPGSFEIMPGGSLGGYIGPVSTQTINVLATAGQNFTAKVV